MVIKIYILLRKNIKGYCIASVCVWYTVCKRFCQNGCQPKVSITNIIGGILHQSAYLRKQEPIKILRFAYMCGRLLQIDRKTCSF